MRGFTDKSSETARPALWLATPLLTGAVVMSLELAAFRLYAPYFGYSIYVWGSMISVVMVALAFGYMIGGRLADRCDSDLPLYLFIISSAAYQFLAIYTVRSLLPLLVRLGDFTGAGLATLIIFVPPMLALALAGPYVIRLLARAGHVGAAAGKVYALSALGSVAGIVATSFYLIPRFGTRTTLLVACALSAIVGLAGLAMRKQTLLIAMVPMIALPAIPGGGWFAGDVWEGESAYNLIRVVRDSHRLMLVLNNESSIQTVRDEPNGWTGYYYDQFALGPLLVEARHCLVLGIGAGGSITTTRLAAPEMTIDAVEIDGKVIEAGARFFGLPLDSDWLRLHTADARPWLAANHERYDLIQVDLYQGGPYIPFYLATVEFFESVRAHMAGDGLLMMNVFDPGQDRELLYAIAATLKQVFRSIAMLRVGGGNYMVLAFLQERSVASVQEQLNRVEHTARAYRLAQDAAKRITSLTPSNSAPILTDDHAPIEDITRRMLANQ